jgi:hypothetical protein
MPFAFYWPHYRAYQPLFGTFGGPITGLLSISTKGEALACSCALLLAPKALLGRGLQGGLEGASKGLRANRRVPDACGRVLCCQGASTLLAIARRCVQQCSTYVSDLHGNTLCHWHAFGMRLACVRIVSRFNRYISVTRSVTEATS